MRTRGFTLLELLIAMGLVLAMAALSLPAVMRLLDERRFEAAADLLMHQMRLTRAHAQFEGVAVELGFDEATGRIEAWYFQPGEEDEADRTDETQPAMAKADRKASPDDDRAVPEGWASRTLDSKLTLSPNPPEVALDPLEEMQRLAGSDSEAFGSGIDSFDAIEPPAELTGEPMTNRRMRLAVFMPDGSALIGRTMWLSDAAGRVGTISINPFTGMPRFVRLEDLEPQVPAAPEEDESTRSAEDELRAADAEGTDSADGMPDEDEDPAQEGGEDG